MTKFLRFYKLWAHDLLPRMSFKDFVRQTEKLCSSRRMRVHLEGLRLGEMGHGVVVSGTTVGGA